MNVPIGQLVPATRGKCFYLLLNPYQSILGKCSTAYFFIFYLFHLTVVTYYSINQLFQISDIINHLNKPRFLFYSYPSIRIQPQLGLCFSFSQKYIL